MLDVEGAVAVGVRPGIVLAGEAAPHADAFAQAGRDAHGKAIAVVREVIRIVDVDVVAAQWE